MSFNNNDEDGDGLAALFGGITPQAKPTPAEAARPAVAPTPGAQQPAPAGYPAGVPGAAPTSAAPVGPGYPTATSYDLPAPTEAPPASAYPAAAPQYPGLSPVPTADPRFPATTYPGGQVPGGQAQGAQVPGAQYPAAQAPVSPSPEQYAPAQYPPTQAPAQQVPVTQYPAGQHPATQYPPTATPVTPTAQYPPAQYPGLETPAGYPGLAPQGTPSAPPSYDLPAPITPTPAGYPNYEQPAAGYSSAPPADFVQPGAYDLPPPAAAPSYDPAPVQDPRAGYDTAARYDTPAGYDSPAGYQQTPSYEPSPASQLSSAAQPTPLVQPAQGQFGAPTPTLAYGGTEPAVGAELLPTPVIPAGPLLPSRTAAVVTPEDLSRSTAGEKVGLALALLAGPIGLLIAIVTAVRGGRRRGWLIGVSRVSLVLGVLSTIATVIVAIIYWNIRVDQMQHDELAAASAEFCAAAEADPAMVTPPTVGFPTQGNSIPETIDAMTAWTTRWTDLAATSPAELSTGLELLAAKGQEIVDSVTESRSVDDVLNAQVIGSIEAQSGVSAWYTNYCVTP